MHCVCIQNHVMAMYVALYAMLISIAVMQRGKNMTEWITCPKCGALMICMTYGHLCPLCGYTVLAQTITTTTGTSVEYVPVIRCKDCKYFSAAGDIDDFPECVGAWNDGSVAVMSHTSPEGYCYRAERKTE